MFITWLGEMITEYGIGNGASLIITINIIARLPGALMSLITLVISGSVTGGSEIHSVHLLILLAMFFLVTAGAIALTQGMRKVPVRYAQRVAGVGKTSTVQTSYLPLKVNYSGVMPIIFAGAILSFPMMFLRFAPDWAFFRWLIPNVQYGSNGYLLIYWSRNGRDVAFLRAWDSTGAVYGTLEIGTLLRIRKPVLQQADENTFFVYRQVTRDTNQRAEITSDASGVSLKEQLLSLDTNVPIIDELRQAVDEADAARAAKKKKDGKAK